MKKEERKKGKEMGKKEREWRGKKKKGKRKGGDGVAPDEGRE